MAKVIIKSERITPFGGIFPVREQFSRFVGPVIDKVLGLPRFNRKKFQFEFENGEVLRIKLYEHLKVG